MADLAGRVFLTRCCSPGWSSSTVGHSRTLNIPSTSTERTPALAGRLSRSTSTHTHTRTATGVAGRREDPYWEARAGRCAGMRAASTDRWAHARTRTHAPRDQPVRPLWTPLLNNWRVSGIVEIRSLQGSTIYVEEGFHRHFTSFCFLGTVVVKSSILRL